MTPGSLSETAAAAAGGTAAGCIGPDVRDQRDAIKACLDGGQKMSPRCVRHTGHDITR